jgi:tetratricopeptide (TPR) repeat protein
MRLLTPRTLRVIIAGGALVVLVAVVGRSAWQRRELERRVVQALRSLEEREPPAIDAALLAALEQNPEYESESRLFQGVIALRRGEPTTALKLFGRVRPNKKVRLPLLLQVGAALFNTGQLAQAQGVFQQVAFEKPGDVAAHRWLAVIHREMGAMYAAFDEFEKVAELESDDYWAFRQMGLLNREDFGRDRDAVENYRMALERRPPPEQLPAIRTEFAQALINVKDFERALEVLSENADDAAVLALKAECHWSLGATETAWRFLERARDLDPQGRAVLLLSGRMALAAGGNPQRAVDALKALLERDPHDVQARYQLSLAYQRLGDQEAAAAELDRMNASKALRTKLAAMYEQAMERPADAEIRDELADLCRQLGQRDLARVWRRAAEQLRRGAGRTPAAPAAGANDSPSARTSSSSAPQGP